MIRNKIDQDLEADGEGDKYLIKNIILYLITCVFTLSNKQEWFCNNFFLEF